MEFSKKKFIESIREQSEFEGNTIDYRRLYYWEFVKLQNIHISEIFEHKQKLFYVLDSKFDEFIQFSFGKKPLLIEKFSNRTNEKTILINEKTYIPINLVLDKIIMSNGNVYEVLH